MKVCDPSLLEYSYLLKKAHKKVSWSEQVTYLESYASVICEKRRINSNFDTMFSFPVFLSVRGYLCKSAGVHFYDFLASYFEFDLF